MVQCPALLLNIVIYCSYMCVVVTEYLLVYLAGMWTSQA